ncbi:MAG: aldo/keto reductase [Burkholderiaceae bacterium]|nr:aldo/keto reductase [Burkholderiaceae bacterium]
MTGTMPLRPCGAGGLVLSAIGLGCWSFGGGDYWGPQDQNDVDAVVRAAVDAGVNYFDTAEAYNEGRSEESLGRALRGVARERVVIGSKVSPGHCYPGVLERHCEASLRRLGIDYLDLYMVHWPIHAHSIRHFTQDPAVIANPPQASAAFEAMLRLRDAGKIRHIGVSNFSARRMGDDIPAMVPCAANQLPYNLLSRAIEFDTLPACRERNVGVIGYMTLLQGVLTGKYASLAQVPAWQRRTRHFDAAGTPLCRHGERGFERETGAAVEAIRGIAADCGMPMAELSTRWALSGDGISCALVGARNAAQLAESLAAARGGLDADVRARLDAATEPLKQAMGNHFDYYESPANDRTA